MVEHRATIQLFASFDGVGEYFSGLNKSFSVNVRTPEARGSVFYQLGEFSMSDAIVVTPDASLFHMVSTISEAEVGNPFLMQSAKRQSEPVPAIELDLKPIVFLGKQDDWQPFVKVLENLKSQGVMRNALTDIVHITEDVEDAIKFIEDNLPADLHFNRPSHKNFTRRPALVEDDFAESPPEISDIGIAVFGSASTVVEAQLQRAEDLGQCIARNKWHTIHGGGKAGVMGALTKGTAKEGAYVHGISTYPTGALNLYASEGGRPKGVSRYSEYKSLPHRVEGYLEHSQGIIAADGGIGTLEEMMMMVELFHEEHDLIKYETVEGNKINKPFIVINADDLHAETFSYINHRGEGEKFYKYCNVVASPEEAVEFLAKYFEDNPPKKNGEENDKKYG